MIAIESITLREIRLPLVEPFRSAGGNVDERRVLLLELTDRDGHSAWSECVAQSLPTYTADTVDTCWLAITEWLALRLRGLQLTGAEDAYSSLSAGIRGHSMAIAALEMGIWALAAVRERIPLATLLARHLETDESQSLSQLDIEPNVARRAPRDPESAIGPSDRRSMYGEYPAPIVESGIALGLEADPRVLAGLAQRAAASGYRRIRIKIAPGCDVQSVLAVREAAGDSMPIIADANGSYSTGRPDHVAALAELDKLGLHMLEQPLAPGELVQHARLQRSMKTTTCMDESVCSLADARTMLEMDCARALNLKPARVGGFSVALSIHNSMARCGIPMWCGGMLESGVGRAFNVALASLPGFTEPGDLSPSSRYWKRDIVEPEWTMNSSGQVQVPLGRPGIGVEVDRNFVDDLTVRVVKLQL